MADLDDADQNAMDAAINSVPHQQLNDDVPLQINFSSMTPPGTDGGGDDGGVHPNEVAGHIDDAMFVNEADEVDPNKQFKITCLIALPVCYFVLIMLWSFSVSQPVLIAFAAACFIPPPIWFYLVYWINRDTHPEVVMVLGFYALGVLAIFPITFIQGIVLMYMYILLAVLTYQIVDTQLLAWIFVGIWMGAFFFDSFVVRAVSEQLAIVAFLSIASMKGGIITSHFIGTVYGLAIGLGFGTLALSLRTLWVAKQSYDHHATHMTPVYIYLQHAILTMTMYAVVGMWIGLGYARRVFLTGRSESSGVIVPYPWWKILTPTLLLQTSYYFILQVVPYFYGVDTTFAPAEDFLSFEWILTVLIAGGVLVAYAIVIKIMFSRTMSVSAYYKPFDQLNDDDFLEDDVYSYGGGGDGGGDGDGDAVEMQVQNNT